LSSLHSQDEKQLRDRINDLLQQVRILREEIKNKDAHIDLVSKLQEANQHLVIAAVGAQNGQAFAEAVNQRQEEFLSMLSHELRNPLAPIAMGAELLGKITNAHPQLPKLHGIISRQVKHLARLVDDLLDASRMSSGKITLKKKGVNLAEVIKSAIETSQPFIDKRNQYLIVELPKNDIVINGDLIRLAQVFSNLLINASKFSPKNECIRVSAFKHSNNVVVSIKDSGIGIAEDIKQHIFDLFTQGVYAINRSQGGLGIGLALVRTIVEMHGGTIKVNSAGTNLGSEFIVEIPISFETKYGVMSLRPRFKTKQNCKILIIEDNIDSSETLSNLLMDEGHIITSTYDGMSGLKLARENNYEVIICDIGLPDMDGYEVVTQLQIHTLKPMPYLIALTGYDQPGYVIRAKEMGFNHYLVKPVDIDKLLSIISLNTQH
jgi:two-component system CheB/CheR fusion protein